jgi:hypothetical protein
VPSHDTVADDALSAGSTEGVPAMTKPAASGPGQFDAATFTVGEPRTFEDLKVGEIFRASSRTLTTPTPQRSKRFPPTTIRSTTTPNMPAAMGRRRRSVTACRSWHSRRPERRCSRSTSATSSSPSPASRAGSWPRSTPLARHFIAYAGPFTRDIGNGPSPIASTSRCSLTGKATTKSDVSQSTADG